MYIISGARRTLALVKRIYERRGLRVFDPPVKDLDILGVTFDPQKVLPEEILRRVRVTEGSLLEFFSTRSGVRFAPGHAVMVMEESGPGRRGVVLEISGETALVALESAGETCVTKVSTSKLRPVSL